MGIGIGLEMQQQGIVNDLIASVLPAMFEVWLDPVNGIYYYNEAFHVGAPSGNRVTLTTPLLPSEGCRIWFAGNAPSTHAAVQTAFSLSDGTTGNSATLRRATATAASFRVTVGSAVGGDLNYTWADGATHTWCGSLATDDKRRITDDGSLGSQLTAAAAPTITQVDILQNAAAGSGWGDGTYTLFGLARGKVGDNTELEVLLAKIPFYHRMAYSWWTDDHAQQGPNGNLYIGGQEDNTLDQIVLNFNPTTLLTEKAIVHRGRARDEHCGVAVGFTSDSTQVYEFCTGHSDDNILGFRISPDLSLLNLGPEINVTPGFPEPLNYTSNAAYNGTILVTTQGSSSNLNWDIWKTTDYKNFVRKKRLFSGDTAPTNNQWYLRGRKISATRWRHVGQVHPENARNILYDLEVDLSNGDVYNGDGTLAGNLDDANPTVALLTHSTIRVVRTPALGHSQRLLDISDDGAYYLIADFLTGDSTACIYIILKVSDLSEVTFEAVGGHHLGSNQSYVRGANFIRSAASPNKSIVAARTALSVDIQTEYASADGLIWVPTDVMTNPSISFARPYSPRNASAKFKHSMAMGNYTDYTHAEMYVPFYRPLGL